MMPEQPIPQIPQQFIPQSSNFQQSSPPAGLQISNQTGHVTNPFRQSMMMATGTSVQSTFATSQPPSVPQLPKSTNPFARNLQSTPTSPTSASTSIGAPSFQQQPQPNTNFLGRSTTTTTNPFSRNVVSTSTSPQATGGSSLSVPGAATNPFRASMMIQQQQAQQQAQMTGSFSGQTGTIGGLENLETVPVFPRPTPNATGTQGGWQ